MTDDRTSVEVLIDNSNCTFGDYNAALMNFFVANPAPATFSSQIFSMYAPQFTPLSPFGLVTFASADPIVAKNNAIKMCRESSVPNLMRVTCS